MNSIKHFHPSKYGVRYVFDNGWGLSVQYGPNHYGSNHSGFVGLGDEEVNHHDLGDVTKVEIAIFTPKMEMMDMSTDSDFRDTIAAYVSVRKLPTIIDMMCHESMIKDIPNYIAGVPA